MSNLHPSWLALFALFVIELFSVSASGQTSAPPGTAQSPRAAPGRYAKVNGLRLYYEIHGSGGVPLVLLHGGGSTIEITFAKVLPAFAKEQQVIAFDQQGHGRTADIADRPFTFEQSADDAVALLDHLQIEKADFFGFSNGGNIAMQIAIRHPKRVRKLVVASAMYKRDGVYPQVFEFIKQSTLKDMPQVLQDAYRQVAPHPEQLQSFHDKCARRMIDFQDWRPADIQSIKAPTLIMIGDADSIRPEHAVDMYRLLPHGQLAILPGGHGAYFGEASAARVADSQVQFANEAGPRVSSKVPELVVALIQEFLRMPMPK